MKCQHTWEVVVGRALAGDEWEYEYEDMECTKEAVWLDEDFGVCMTHAIEEYGISEAAFRAQP